MTWAKRIYILITKVNKLFSFSSSRCFLKEIENMYSVFLSSYTNTRESLGELEKAVETLACGSCSHNISRSPKLPLVFVWLDRNTVRVFYFLIILWIAPGTGKGPGKRGHIVADTLLPTQMFPRLPARATFVADTNFVSATQKMSVILLRHILCP